MEIDVPMTVEGREVLRDRARQRIKTIKSAAVSLAITTAQIRWMDGQLDEQDGSSLHERTEEIMDGVNTILDGAQ